MREKYYYIYITFNLINDRFYVGQRSCYCLPEEDVRYLGSGTIFRRALKKYGRNNFQKEIIEIVNKDNIDEKEKFYIQYFDARNQEIGGYNLRTGGHSRSLHADETKAKIGELSKQRWSDPEYREMMCQINGEINRRPEVAEKKSKAMKRPETKERHSLAVKAGKKKYDTSEAGRKGWKGDTERRSKLSARIKERMQNEEYKKEFVKNMVETKKKNGEYKILTELTKQRWANPEYKSLMSKKISETRLSPEFKAKLDTIMESKRVKVNAYNENGDFLGTFTHAQNAADKLGIAKSVVKTSLKENRYVKGLLFIRTRDDIREN